MIIRNLRNDGTPNGILMRLVRSKTGYIGLVFQVMVSVGGKKIRSTSYSMEKHGDRGAWKKAVNKLLEFRKIDPISEDAKKIRLAMNLTMERF